MKKLIYLFAIVILAAMSCENKLQTDKKIVKIDSVIISPLLDGDVEKTIALADSFERIGSISHIHASNRRGEAYIQKGMMTEADAELKSAVTGTVPQTLFDSVLYYTSIGDLVQYQSVRKNHDSVIALAVPTLEAMKNLKYTREYSNEVLTCKAMLYLYLGLAQSSLKKVTEYDKSYDQVYLNMNQLLKIDTSWATIYNVSMTYHNCTSTYLIDKRPDKAVLWLSRTDSIVEKLNTYQDIPDSYKEQIKFYSICDHIDYNVLQGRIDEANRYFDKAKKSPISQTPNGKYKIIGFLRNTHRYAEAADAYQTFDQFRKQHQMEASYEYIDHVVGKFKVNYWAGRKDSALAAAMYAFDFIDSAIVHERNGEAAMLATIYETKQKDEEIAQQQIELNRQRFLALAVVLVLITAFFIVYTLFRRRAAKRLAEVKAAQERIESELRIARNIQMSMVPSTFPMREGLDLYASMKPAKEVGGDLYGYVINGNNLYFAVGDVSGKGVPASLFMAQATRLFRTMAAQGLQPAEICNHMNVELSGDDNVNGMFVTMFIGMLNMESGHFHFCNAGHNPPVIGGGESHGDYLKMEPNAPIGLWPDLEYVGEEIDSIKGRALFVYTDGLNEAENMEQKQFGDDRLLQILRDTHFDTARQVVETLFAQVEDHRAGAEPNDDLTILCLRVG